MSMFENPYKDMMGDPKKWFKEQRAADQALPQGQQSKSALGFDIPVLGPIVGGFGEAEKLGTKAKELGVAAKLQMMRIGKEMRATRGEQISKTARAGVELSGSTQNLLTATEAEYELDRAILRDWHKRTQQEINWAQTQARVGGIMGGLGGFLKS